MTETTATSTKQVYPPRLVEASREVLSGMSAGIFGTFIGNGKNY